MLILGQEKPGEELGGQAVVLGHPSTDGGRAGARQADKQLVVPQLAAVTPGQTSPRAASLAGRTLGEEKNVLKALMPSITT